VPRVWHEEADVTRERPDRASIVAFLRRHARLAAMFECPSSYVLEEFAERIEAREDLLPDGVSFERIHGNVAANAKKIDRLLADVPDERTSGGGEGRARAGGAAP
jgi:hypothetical protein